jgi:hypothetical protein
MEKTNERDFHAEAMGSEDSAPDSALRKPDGQPPLSETPPSTTQEGDKELEAAGQKIPPVKKRPPKVELLEHQLNMAARDSGVGGLEKKASLRKGTIALYHSLSPKDSIDSMLAGVIVGISNLTMECISRAGSSLTNASGEINLRYAIKGAMTLVQLTEAYEGRRGRGRRHVTVGAVNVEQGGQVIVGNVEPQRLEPSPPAGSSTDESEK